MNLMLVEDDNDYDRKMLTIIMLMLEKKEEKINEIKFHVM